jgi:hypothetical protein|nr:hypothetical protein [uncultured Amphritea sp.]
MQWTLALFACCASTFSVAAPLSAPSGPVILTISGTIEHTQDGQTAKLDLATLQALESDTFEMQTRWSNSLHRYHGPRLSAILNYVGAQGSHIRLTALNDYSVEFKRQYMSQYEPIVAWSEDGKQLSIREKGPLWLMIPHHKFPELNSEINTGRMIWQLSKIEIF